MGIYKYIYIYIYIHLCIYIYTFIYICIYIILRVPVENWGHYGVATISMVLKNTDLLCKRALQKRPIFSKFIELTLEDVDF